HVGPDDVPRHVEADRPGERHHVVLIDAVAGDAEAADERAGAVHAPVDRRAAGEEDDAVLVGQVVRLAEVRLREEGVVPCTLWNAVNGSRGPTCKAVSGLTPPSL